MSEPPNSRRGAFIALVVVIFLIVGGVWISGVLHRTGAIQDCAMQGRTNC